MVVERGISCCGVWETTLYDLATKEKQCATIPSTVCKNSKSGVLAVFFTQKHLASVATVVIVMLLA